MLSILNATHISRMVWRPIFVTFIVLIASTHAEAHAVGVVLGGSGTAKIDGALSAGEWAGAGCISIAVNVLGGGTAPGSVCAMNDTNNLYLAISFATTAPGNSAAFLFDNDHSGGTVSTGDDALVMGSSFADDTWAPCPFPSPFPCSFFDTAVGGTNDGSGALAIVGGQTIYEFAHPLDSGDSAHDFSLSPGDTVGFSVSITLLGSGTIVDTDLFSGFGGTRSGDIVIAPIFAVAEPSSLLLLGLSMLALLWNLRFERE